MQEIFNEIKNDEDYTIHLCFFCNILNKGQHTDTAFKGTNENPPIDIPARITADFFNLDNIYTLYYGKSFNEEIGFKFTLTTQVAKNILKILPEEYKLPTMSKAFYMLTPVHQLYDMNKSANEKNTHCLKKISGNIWELIQLIMA